VGCWRFAFAFDPSREAIIFCGGDKSVGSSDVFYKQLIKTADQRFDDHLKRIKEKEAADKHLKSKHKRN
jgi:hypothetical protein